MDATLPPSGTFQHLLHRWRLRAAGGKRPADLAKAMVAFFGKRVLLSAVCISALSAVAGATCMYWLLAGDLPALRADFRKVATELYVFHSDLNVADAQQRGALDEHIARERASRAAISSSLHALAASMIVLRQKAEGTPLQPREARELLASVRAIAVAEASGFESITTLGGVIPQEHTPLLRLVRSKEDDLDEIASFFSVATPSAHPGYLGRLLLTRNGAWRAGEREILFKWDGGSARLRAGKDLPRAEIQRKVDLFNSVSQAVGQAAPGVALQAVPRASLAPHPAIEARTQSASRVEPPPRARPASAAPRQAHVLPRVNFAARPDVSLSRPPTPAP